MNPQDPLAGLHPLRQPEAIGLWPPAPGWWLLAAVVVLALCCAVYLLLKHRAANRYRRQALRQLDALYSQFQDTGEGKALAAGVNALLKRVAINAFPQQTLAASHGGQWLAFLRDSCDGKARFDTDFTTAIYRSDNANLDTQGLYRDAQAWIRHHRRPA